MKNRLITSKGKSYSIDELIKCIESHGYLYDFKAGTQIQTPFTIEDLATLLSDAELYSAYETALFENFGPIIKECHHIKGDTLQLMDNLLKAFNSGAQSSGNLSLFLTSETDFALIMTEPLNAFYTHLDRYPSERKALSNLSNELQRIGRNFNFIDYLEQIKYQNMCASGFPDVTSAMFSLISTIKVYLIEADKRSALQDNKLDSKGNAFFDSKPMTHFQNIRVEGLTHSNPDIESTIQKLIIFLNANENQIQKISVQNNSLTIHTIPNRQYKTQLRENLQKQLDIDIDNISGYFAFVIKDVRQLKEKLSAVVDDRDEDGILSPILK